MSRIIARIAATTVSMAVLACAIAVAAGREPAERPTGTETTRFGVVQKASDEGPNPTKIALGRTLFFDKNLSGPRTLSCASCHEPKAGWSNAARRGPGVAEGPDERKTPSLTDAAGLDRLGWDGRFDSIEAVTFAPITSPTKMGLHEDEALTRLRADPSYTKRFEAAFGTAGIDRARVEQALGAYERHLPRDPSPFERWLGGDAEAIDPQVIRGFRLFAGKAGCASCHDGPGFTDGSFHDIGIGPDNDVGRGKYMPRSAAMRHAFKTPGLRDVATHAPYMHDGSLATLRDVVEHYDRAGRARGDAAPARPSLARELKPLGLTESEKDDIVAFLTALTGISREEGE